MQPKSTTDVYDAMRNIQFNYINTGCELKQKCFLWMCLVIFVAIMFVPKASYADSFDDCNSAIAKQIISGCTDLIQNGDLSSENLILLHNRRSTAFIEQENYSDAIADLSELMELSPENADAKMRLAMAYTLRGQNHIGNKEWDEAIADFESAHKLQSNKASFKKQLVGLYDLRADELHSANNHKVAIAFYSKAIALDDKNEQLYASRAEAYAAINDVNNAVTDFLTAIDLKPDFARAYRRLGELFMSIGLKKDAIIYYDEALKIMPNNAGALLLRALAHEKNETPLDALTDYTAVLKIDPMNKDAKEGQKRLYESTSQLAKLVQIELKVARCYNGKVDGDWGRGSRAAMQRFRKIAGFPERILKKIVGISGDYTTPSTADLEFVTKNKGVYCSVIKKKLQNRVVFNPSGYSQCVYNCQFAAYFNQKFPKEFGRCLKTCDRFCRGLSQIENKDCRERFIENSE